MFVILVYDISTLNKKGKKRLRKILKLARINLHHIQKSVFEGEISEAVLKKFKYEIEKIIDKKEDYVVIYKCENKNNIQRENIGIDFDPTNEII